MILIGILVATWVYIITRRPYTTIDDRNEDWKMFFRWVKDVEDDLLDDWRRSVEDNKIDIDIVYDMIDDNRVGELPELLHDCKFRHLFAIKLIDFYS